MKKYDYIKFKLWDISNQIIELKELEYIKESNFYKELLEKADFCINSVVTNIISDEKYEESFKDDF